MEVWKPTSVTAHLDNLCREPVGQRPQTPQSFVFSALADWTGSDMQFFDVRKPVETQEQLLEVIQLLRETDGNA